MPPISSIIQVRRAKHAGYCWWNRKEFSEVLEWRRKTRHARVGWKEKKTFIDKLCVGTWCREEDRSWVMADKEWWHNKVKESVPSTGLDYIFVVRQKDRYWEHIYSLSRTHTNIYIYIYIYVHFCYIYIYIYIYRERERERERDYDLKNVFLI